MTNYEKLLEEVRALGMDHRWAKMFVKKLEKDEAAFPTDEATKRWALQRGFYPGRVALYGLTEENYRDYMPDWNYFMLHPLNHHFRKWLDKLTLKYVLNSNGCESTMPAYYLYVENNDHYTYLMDAPAHIKKDKDFLFHLLKEKGTLVMKPNSGTSGGLGFVKMELRDGQLYENNKPIDMAHYQQTISNLRNYIVTEYCYQHDELAAVWPDSECTLRIIMAKDPKEDLYTPDTWSCVLSFARFGTSVNGGASNLSSGGVGIGFDYETGKYCGQFVRYRAYCSDGNWLLPCHPDTHAELEGKELPNWPLVKQMIERVCQHITSLDYLGLDIIITEDGMKLCEINTHPAMDYAQIMCGPTLVKPQAQAFFASKNLYRFSGEDLWQAYVKCQE